MSETNEDLMQRDYQDREDNWMEQVPTDPAGAGSWLVFPSLPSFSIPLTFVYFPSGIPRRQASGYIPRSHTLRPTVPGFPAPPSPPEPSSVFFIISYRKSPFFLKS